jgi:hypothetical protein
MTISRPRPSMFGRRVALGGCAALVVALAGAAPAMAEDKPWWGLSTSAAPSNLPTGGEGHLIVVAANHGNGVAKGSTAPITLTDTLPAGLKATKVFAIDGTGSHFLTCQPLPALSCTYPHDLQPYERVQMTISVKVEGAPGHPVNEVHVTGGGATAAGGSQALTVSSTPAVFGTEKYELRPENEDGSLDTQGGSHPYQLTTTLALNQTAFEEPVSTPRTLQFSLPPGLIGNIVNRPQCSEVDFTPEESANHCPANTALGVAEVTIREPKNFKEGPKTFVLPIFNLVPSKGEPARFGIAPLNDAVVLDTAVRTGSDYGVVVTATNTSQAAGLIASSVTFWGTPGDPSHDSSRGWECIAGESERKPNMPPCAPLGDPNPPAFLTLPTACGSVLHSPMRAQSWVPGAELLPAFESELPESLTGCELLPFGPSLTVEPEQHAASTPTGLTVNVKVPQENLLSPSALSQSAVRETTVQLPQGIELNPAAAGGLLACGPEQFGFIGTEEPAQTNNDEFSAESPSCPDPAKVGTVRIKTPVLEHELTGSVYLARQDTNPFRAPLVLYLVAKDPISGVLVKLAGTTTPDPVTGQITSTFSNTPQVPFEELELTFFKGGRASLSTPAFCGAYTTTTQFTPWSGTAAATPSANFEIGSGPAGGPCPSNPLPFAPAFQAGSVNTQAAAFTPFTLTIGKPDGQQSLNGITVHLPEGMAALLSSVTPCPEPPVGQPWACGAESLLGHATTTSGLGSEPFSLSGNVYITTGYDGAPFGLLVETAAKAGPFDLGLVDVRSRINVDPNTAAVTVTTDGGPRGEIVPTFLKGVPVQLKQINVTIDRPGFQFNGTNCNPTSITGTLNGDGGTAASVSSPFQVTGCAGLKFGPKLTAEAGKQGSKNNGDSLNVTVESAGLGQANIKKVSLQLPAALPSRLTTIQKACLAAVFAANPASCPEGSNIGHAKISTPVLKNPLQGPAYLVSYGSAKFPDVEFVLQGEGILLILDGHTDIKKGITYSRFEAAPDAPFSKFVTELPAGPHSALTAFVPVAKNYSLCGTKLLMPTEIVAQNGALIKQTTNIAVKGCSGVLPFKMTRAQKLAKALKACHKKKNKHKRVACEKQARKKYGTHHKAAKKHTKKK